MRVSSDSVGARISALRKQRGLTLRQVGVPGCSGAYICRIERGGRRPSVKALRLIAERLETTVSYLETGITDPAEELARQVLNAGRQPVPAAARRLARQILGAERRSSVAV
jgi:transcriptional regulator with XRE-family HTH domain